MNTTTFADEFIIKADHYIIYSEDIRFVNPDGDFEFIQRIKNIEFKLQLLAIYLFNLCLIYLFVQ